MFREASVYLEKEWISSKDRKPLVIRGARQVGKTWIVREIAKKTKKQLIEINFERSINIKSLFDTTDPKVILQNLEVYLGSRIDLQSSILFLDEIQEAPDVLAKLRWFYEEIPSLPIVAAGSLLEFAIEGYRSSMPVGRISYLHLEPLSFEEFLYAEGKEILVEYMEQITIPHFKMPEAIHERLQNSFKRYMQIGGMPAAVLRWVESQSLNSVFSLQQDLLATYRDDFFKYKGRIDVQKLDILLKSIPLQLGEKFMYSKADSSIQTPTAKQILLLFNKARLCHMVQNSSGNGVPLAGEIKSKSFKQVFLDTGLVNRLLGNDFEGSKTIIEGKISEQVVGQMLRCLFPFYKEPTLYYWHREEKGSSSEVDYLIEHNAEVIPIEVKAGSTGSLKSLHFFMNNKNLPRAIRINNDIPSITQVNIQNTSDMCISYTLLSIPYYLTGQIHRLLDLL